MTTTPAGYVRLRGSERHPAPGATLLGPADPGERFPVTIVLRRRPDAEPMPGSEFYATTPPSQRPRLPEDEFAARYGASPADIAVVTGFAAANGLTVIEASAARRGVRVSGTVAQMENAFGVSLGMYQVTGLTPSDAAGGAAPATRAYRGRDGFISAPPELAEVVVGVFGLDNRPITKTNSNGDPSGTGQLDVPTIAGLYNFPTTSAGGQTIAIISGGGYDTSPGPGNDFARYFATLPGLTAPDIIAVPPASSSENHGPDAETTQDICIAATVAQKATIGVYFLSYFGAGQNAWHDLIERVVTPDPGDFPAGVSPPSVLSSSFYISDGDDTGTLAHETITSAFVDAVHMALEDAARQNITVCAAAGDQGSDSKVGSQAGITEWNEVTGGLRYNFAPDNKAHVQYPGSDPYVLSCGGTTVGNVGTTSFDEYVWNDSNPGGAGGLVSAWATGGGVSDYFTGSSAYAASYGYQDGVTVPASVNDGHAGRGVPDVAGNASLNSGYPYFVNGKAAVMSGTSAVAPLYAGLIAVINASLPANAGFLNPMLYVLGNSVCRDINAPPGPTGNSLNGVAGYQAAAGWDACTGWGVIDGRALQSALKAAFQPAVSLILDRSTFGKDEVTASLAGGSAQFTDALYVAIDGLHPDQVGLNSGNLTNPPGLAALITFHDSFPALPGVSLAFDATAGVLLEDPTDFFAVQRMTFPFNVIFAEANGTLPAFSAVSNPPGYADYQLSVTVSAAAAAPYPAVSLSSSVAEVELVLQPDPYMMAGETWWLSNDMRVFTVTPTRLRPGQTPLQYSTTPWGPDPNTYIANLISELNTSFTSPATTNTPFDAIPAGEDQSALMLSQYLPSHGGLPPAPVFNFALARVRLRGDTAANVRVFFRLFISPSPDTDFDPATTFRSAQQTDTGGNPIPGTLIPLLGFPATDMSSTIPFFAAPRIISTTDKMTRQPDPANVQQIPSPSATPPPPPGAPVYAYFGCWLDINQPAAQFPLDPQATGKPDGPWSSPMDNILPIPAIIMGNHACLVAEIAYDPDPIPSGANAATSDKIGQRNLSWGGSDNPGPAPAHLVPTLFDIRPTAAGIPASSRPDELMIDWGNTPAGTVASLYWPQVDAGEVLQLADRFYTASRLSQGDAHTIQCVTGAVTYIPIPPGAGPNFAGLLSLQLPQTVLAGQEFNVLVRRLSSRSAALDDAPGAVRKNPLSWHYVVGAFQVRIPVGTARSLLPVEESILAVYKWKLEQIPAANRWHPVLERYVAQVSGRVSGMGGNPAAIRPSPLGAPGAAGGQPAARREFTGKVSGIDFDRFGDFTGFRLRTESGADMPFHAAEETIERLIRDAWTHRWVITVIVETGGGIERPAAFILRRPGRG